MLDDVELIDLVGAIHTAVSIRKLRITGGEPLLRPDLPELIAGLRRRLPAVALCLTTNGTLLGRTAAALRKAGLQRINISLDTADESVFRKLTRSRGLDRVLEGIAAAHDAGFETMKLNTVLLRSCNAADLEGLVRTAAKYDCEIRFVELMPFGEGAALFAREFLPASETLAKLKARFPYLGIRGCSSTAERHSLDVDGRPVTVGFIPSVTRPFCKRCDRLRLDSRGRLYGCLRSRRGAALCASQTDGTSFDATSILAGLNRVIHGRGRSGGAWPSRSMALLGG